MAKKDEKAATVKARVLADGVFGKIDDVIEIDPDVAEQSGDLDPHPDAVAYAEAVAAEAKAAAKAKQD